MLRGHHHALSWILAASVGLLSCSSAPPAPGTSREASGVGEPLPGVALGKDVWVGKGVLVQNLTVFPVYARDPRDVGDFTTLAKAIQLAKAEVREIGADGEGPRPMRGRDVRQEEEDEGASASARVDTLVIENRGELPILILAGTVVKGGKQDRQIGEDFVVPPKQTVDVSAFCVEQGRWDASREGASTGGKFTAQATLATGQVRAAGQYDKDQSAVWKNVADANKAHDKQSDSGTLLATLDDADVTAKRHALSRAAAGVLESAPDQARLVGLAYAVDGEVRGVRWFAGPKLFHLFQETLLETAAFEAITSQAEARAAGKPSAPAVAAKEDAVVSFTDDMMAAPVAETEAEAGQVRALKKSDKGYASELVIPEPDAPKGKPKGKGKGSITVDLFKKK